MLYILAIMCGGSLAALVLLAGIIGLIKYLWCKL